MYGARQTKYENVCQAHRYQLKIASLLDLFPPHPKVRFFSKLNDVPRRLSEAEVIDGAER
jgi:hypothetical protein